MQASSAVGHGTFAHLGRALAAASAAVLLLLPVGCLEKNPEVKKSVNYLIEAREAIAAGDNAKAMEALNASIEAQPNNWALFERAKLQLEAGDEEAALASCEQALELDSESADVLWLKGEIEKPKAKRFKGRFKNPPSKGK